MNDRDTRAAEPAPARRGLLAQARELLRNVRWLAPTASLDSRGGRDFGRQIEASLTELGEGDGILRLQLRKRDAAVVISLRHYEEMLRMKRMVAELVDRAREKEVARAADEYEALYRRITAPRSRQAADALFSADAPALRESYRPGDTETR